MRTMFGFLLLAVAASGATADVIAVIGTGKVGSALGTEFAAEGHTIVYGSRDPSSEAVRSLVQRTGAKASATFQSTAIKDANIVILAVPGMLAGDIRRYLEWRDHPGCRT
jgi:predicted dinucleotide-binding enzyme